MPLYHTEEQAMLADSVGPFLAEKAPVKHMRALRDSGDVTGFDKKLWRDFAELGLNGILIDEANGGSGLGHVEAGIVLESIGRNLTPSPFLSTSVGAVSALNGSDQFGHWAPKIASGEVIAALAFEERARHRPNHIELKAERSGNGFKLTGAKRFVVHGHVADLVIVAARTAGGVDEEAGVTLFAIDKADAAKLSAEADRLADASFAARLEFDGVSVGADAVLGEVDQGWSALGKVLNAVRAGASSELVGVGGGAMDMTVGYLKERKQFGQIIGSFQALQHRAAHLYSEMEVARAATLKAQQLLDANDPEAEAAVHIAKGVAGMATALAVQEGVQMHGGIGMTDEYDVGLFMKRQRVLAEMFGDSDFHADRLARLQGY